MMAHTDPMEGKKNHKCPFCDPPRERIIVKNDLAYALWDVNPVSRGHTLIIPFRHVASFFDTTPEERSAIMDISVVHRTTLDSRYNPAGYNLGVNAGQAAGQLIMHVHFHLIPRYRGDSQGRGSGLRHVIPKPCGVQKTLTEYAPGS
ncbi:MAG: HIT family protein [Methanoregulaceae archaeon]|nr:HIT family protein [Methanoregulaceae archaeon]